MRSKRRERQKTAELARLLVRLDDIACERRSWRPRRAARVVLGGAR